MLLGSDPSPRSTCSNPPVPPCADARFAGVTQNENGAVSNYNGMVISFEQRFTKWGNGMFQVNYTYGHALDEVSNGGLGQFTYGSSAISTGCQQSSWKLWSGGLRRAPFVQRKLRLGITDQRGTPWTWPGLPHKRMAALGNDHRSHWFSLLGD